MVLERDNGSIVTIPFNPVPPVWIGLHVRITMMGGSCNVFSSCNYARPQVATYVEKLP